jgi:hypothetical protein
VSRARLGVLFARSRWRWSLAAFGVGATAGWLRVAHPSALTVEVVAWTGLAGAGLGYHLALLWVGLTRLAAVRRGGANGLRRERARAFVRGNLIRSTVKVCLLLVGASAFLPPWVFPVLMFAMLILLDVQSALEWRYQRRLDRLARLRAFVRRGEGT